MNYLMASLKGIATVPLIEEQEETDFVIERLDLIIAKRNTKKNLVDGKYLAPSIKNKLEKHIDIFKSFHEVCPIKDAYFEMGQFDIQLLRQRQERT